MDDKELLTLAAKAAGYGEVWYVEGSDTAYVGPKYVFGEPIGYKIFNPLTDDGDALRLAVKLKIETKYQAPDYRPNWTINTHVRGSDIYASDSNEDPYAATRRAIVKAAAEIGRGME